MDESRKTAANQFMGHIFQNEEVIYDTGYFKHTLPLHQILLGWSNQGG
jgi:hypothetical protein